MDDYFLLIILKNRLIKKNANLATSLSFVMSALQNKNENIFNLPDFQ